MVAKTILIQVLYKRLLGMGCFSHFKVKDYQNWTIDTKRVEIIKALKKLLSELEEK